MSEDQSVLCALCGEPTPEWYLKISAGIWCQNCDDGPNEPSPLLAVTR